MNIKKGDKVKMLYGKDSGKTGDVLAVFTKTSKIVIGGINKVKRHLKGDGKKRKSEIIEIERPVPVAKVMIICPNCNKTTRVGKERKGAGYVRICKKCAKTFGEKKEEVKVKKTETKKVTKKKSKK